MKTIKIRLDDATMARLEKASATIGYSSPEEFVGHVLSRELDRLAPPGAESEEDIRRRLEGLGYMT
jgi:hypothetical protein